MTETNLSMFLPMFFFLIVVAVNFLSLLVFYLNKARGVSECVFLRQNRPLNLRNRFQCYDNVDFIFCTSRTLALNIKKMMQ